MNIIKGCLPTIGFFLKSYKIISKSGMRLEVLMGNKISEKFVLINEGKVRPLKCLESKTPYEVFYVKILEAS
jgi:hypothetical protein